KKTGLNSLFVVALQAGGKTRIFFFSKKGAPPPEKIPPPPPKKKKEENKESELGCAGGFEYDILLTLFTGWNCAVASLREAMKNEAVHRR
ncbi:MAG: hypothetical protein FWG50_11835, partial [Kiritimatiellaeota bacterium]|nr:hypothetical protein [Kiritimatiellota bacterium]